MHKTRISIVIAVLATAGAISGATSTASAAPPSSPPLVPPPPSFETCQAIGSGTICSGTRSEAYGPEDTGITCGTGPSAFDVYDQATLTQTARRFYDENGNWVRRQEYDSFTGGQWSNLLSSKTAQYTQRNIDTLVLGTPGEESTGTDTETGEVIMRTGTGSPVLFTTGRQVYSPTGDLVSTAGRNDLVAYFFQGDTHALDSLCTALS